jgi:hypothetical protein
MTTKKFWELGRTRLGDGEASNADHASGGYGGGTGMAAIFRTTDF